MVAMNRDNIKATPERNDMYENKRAPGKSNDDSRY